MLCTLNGCQIIWFPIIAKIKTSCPQREEISEWNLLNKGLSRGRSNASAKSQQQVIRTENSPICNLVSLKQNIYHTLPFTSLLRAIRLMREARGRRVRARGANHRTEMPRVAWKDQRRPADQSRQAWWTEQILLLHRRWTRLMRSPYWWRHMMDSIQRVMHVILIRHFIILIYLMMFL